MAKAKKKTKKTHNIVNLISSNDKDFALDNNLTFIDNKFFIHSSEESNEDIYSFILVRQKAIFDQIL